MHGASGPMSAPSAYSPLAPPNPVLYYLIAALVLMFSMCLSVIRTCASLPRCRGTLASPS
jgi:hypothetical protein